MITPDIEDRLFAYMNGIVENNKSKLILANGTADHVHLLIYVLKYIGNQKNNHRKTDFKAEYRAFMDKYQLEYDERYCWD